MDKMKREGIKKCRFFVHAQGIKTVHAGGVKKWQNSVHVVVECPLRLLAFVFRIQSLKHKTMGKFPLETCIKLLLQNSLAQ